MATHSGTLAWKIPWMEEPGRLQSMGSLDMTEQLPFHFSFSSIGEGNGSPLQCSCLESPSGGAWWAAVYGVAQSRTQRKRLSSSSSSLEGERWCCSDGWLIWRCWVQNGSTAFFSQIMLCPQRASCILRTCLFSWLVFILLVILRCLCIAFTMPELSLFWVTLKFSNLRIDDFLIPQAFLWVLFLGQKLGNELKYLCEAFYLL